MYPYSFKTIKFANIRVALLYDVSIAQTKISLNSYACKVHVFPFREMLLEKGSGGIRGGNTILQWVTSLQTQ